MSESDNSNMEDTLPDGSYQPSGAELKSLNVAAKLDGALSFLRSTAITNDYFTGYSLNEIIQERIALIGEIDDKTDSRVADESKLTMVAALNQLLVELVGEGPAHDGGAIKEALDLDVANIIDPDEK